MMKKLLMTALILTILVLAGSVTTFGLVQVNLEDAINGKANTQTYNEVALSGNVVLPVIGLKIDGEYDSGTTTGLNDTQLMAGAGFRLIKLGGFNLFAGLDYLNSTVGSDQVTVTFYDASLGWRITKHISVDAWLGNSLTVGYNGISVPAGQIWRYQARFTYWLVHNAGVSVGVKEITLHTGLPGANFDFNGIYLGLAARL